MRKLCLILLFSVGALLAQETLYQEAFKKAMSDSVITDDEKSLLDLIDHSPDSLTIADENALEEPLNQEGRWRMIYYNMAVGNSLYGFGIPYLLKSDNPLHYIGFQFVATAGGFYITYNQTRDIDLSFGRTSFMEMGATLGMTSIFPIHALVGIRNWNEFDPHYRGVLTYMMAAAPVGMYFGNRVFDTWQPSDGQASMITTGAGLGFANGIAIPYLLIPESLLGSETAFNNTYRATALMGYGGALAGLYYTHEYLGDKPYTTGDALLTREASSLGSYVALQLINIADFESTKLNVLMGLALINGFTWWGDQLVDDVDFTEGDAVIIAMGTIAANGVWRGINIMAGGDISSEVSGGLDIATSMLGFYTTYLSVKERRLELGYPARKQKRLDFKIKPSLWGNLQNPAPGMSVKLNF